MVTVEKICNVIHGLKPVLLMVVVQAAFAGVNVFYKLANNDGMNLRVLVAYRFLFSAVFIVPIALVVERNKRPKLTWTVLFQAFCCGLLGGSLVQNLYAQALVLTSATFAAATTNLNPAITFVLAACFGMEKVGWRTTSGKAKILGTVIGVGGAMVLTFCKGPAFNFFKTSIDLLHHHNKNNIGQPQNPHDSGKRVLGSLLAIASCFSYSSWLILQTKMIQKYPCPYSITALTSLMGGLQGAVFGLCTERNWSEWKLGWNIRLLTVAYSGMVASGVMYTLIAWCVQMRGPLFVSAFNPLMLVIVAIAGSLFLDETLHLGSVIGAVLIIIGLYAVLWGKGKEGKKAAQLVPVGEVEVTGESRRSSLAGVNGDSKHSSIGSINGESKRVEIVITSSDDNENNPRGERTAPRMHHPLGQI